MKTTRSIVICCLLCVLLTQIGRAQWVQLSAPTGDIRYLEMAGSTMFAQTVSGFVYSTDFGLHWTQANAAFADSLYKNFSVDTANYLMGLALNQIPTLPGNITNLPIANVEVSALLTLMAGVSMLYPGTPFDSVLVSLDTGTTALRLSQLVSEYAYYATGLSTINPLSGQFIRGILFSVNGGTQWIPVYDIVSTISIRMLATTDNYLFAATSNGVYRTNDIGGTWKKVNSGLADTDVYALTSVNNVLFAGTDGGVYRTTDEGATWQAVNTGLTNIHVRALAASGTNVFAGTHGGGVFLSTNYGSLWNPVNEGLFSLNVNALVACQGELYAGTSGGLWERPVSEMATQVVAVLSLSRTSLRFPSTKLGQKKDTTIIVTNLGTDTLKVMSITSNKSYFSARPVALTIPPGQAKYDTIRFVPDAIGTRTGIIVLVSNDVFGTDTVQVSGYGVGTGVLSLSNPSIAFSSTTIGHWRDTIVTVSNTGTDTLKISSIIGSTGHFSARPSVLTIPQGQLRIDTVRFQPDAAGAFADTLYFHNSSLIDPVKLALSGKGITTGVAQAGEDIPTAYTLAQNYPNPFNPSTTIRFSIPARSSVHLVISNILGQQVAELANEEFGVGNFERVWNANVASGLYFYRLEAVSISDPSKRFVEVKKMILLK